jgi:hypothetical protein
MGHNRGTIILLMKSAPHVTAIAVVLLLGSLTVLAAITADVVSAVDILRRSGQPLTSLLNARVDVLGVLPGIFSLLGLTAALGLLRQREWARRTTLYLATVPVTLYSLLVVLRPSFLFPPDVQGAILTIGDLGYAVCVYSVVGLVPITTWWVIVLTRVQVRAQFR